MAKHAGLYLLSALILIIFESAQTFVLFTANMKDIKKIASSFVSDALADKIAEFVMKATDQISEQNEDSGNNKINIDTSSREFESPNFGRQQEKKPRNSESYSKDKYNEDDRYKDSFKKDKDSVDNKDSFFKDIYKKDSLTKDNLKPDDYIKEKYNNKADFDNNKNKQHSINWSKENKEESGDRFDHEQKKWHKEVVEIDSNERPGNTFGGKNKNDWTDRLESFKSNENTRSPSRFSTTERENWKKKDETRVENKISSEEIFKLKFDDDERDRQRPEKESNIFHYNNKQFSGRPKSKMDTEQGYSKTESKFPRYESKVFKNRQLGRSDERLNRDRFKTVVNSAESRDTKYFKRDKWKNIYRSADLTTKKERTDFDQYDNRNYPKAEFVATSGNLMLPRVFVHKKEGNQEKVEAATEKAWWEKKMPAWLGAL